MIGPWDIRSRFGDGGLSFGAVGQVGGDGEEYISEDDPHLE